MNREEAIKILGISEEMTAVELKKHYRSLIIKTHPDIIKDHDYPYDAAQINAAYEFLDGSIITYEDISKSKVGDNNRKAVIKWDAPINANAFADRDIYYNVEDEDGVIGKAVIDTGKYMWTADEEFSLFLSSLYESSKEIIGSADSRSISLQAEITYLLAQQFVDVSTVLNLSSVVGSIGEDTYLADAMIEDVDHRIKLKEGDYLIPECVKNHRLYVKTAGGEHLGYVSFKDDRLYYGIIPLFERKAVQIKMQVTDSLIKRQRGRTYIEISLMIKLLKEDKNQIMEDINTTIERLLK